MEGIGVLSYEPIAASAMRMGRMSTSSMSNYFPHIGRSKILMQLSLKLEGFVCVDPPEQSQLQRISGLEVALARFDVLRYSYFD